MLWVDAKLIPSYVKKELPTAKIKAALEKEKIEYDTFEYILNVGGYAVEIELTYEWSDKRGMKWSVKRVGKWSEDGIFVNYWFN